MKLFGGGEEPEDATNDDGLLLSTDDERFNKAADSSGSFARTVSLSNDSIQSEDDDDDDEKRDDSNNSPTSATVTANATSISNNMNVDEWELLQDENEQLRRQVADLTSALVARDMEIASLRERCQHLMASVEQQDEVIAKIYAAASNSPPKSTVSSKSGNSISNPVKIPTQAARVPADVHKHKRNQGFLQVTESPNKSQHEIANKHSKKKTLENMRRYPGAAASVEPARELLEAHLDSMGYQQQRADDAIESLSREGVVGAQGHSIEDDVEVLSAGMLDRLLFPSPPKNEPLFGDSGGILKSGPRSVASSPEMSLRKVLPPQSPFMERKGSVASEEDFAKSAGFLRKANRKLSGRLSVSDFGLLGDDTQLSGHSGSSSSHSSNQPEDGSDADATDGSSSKCGSQRRTASQRNLFGEIDVALNEEAKRKKEKQKAASAIAEREKQEDELTYAQFLERISLPGSRDILDSIRKFIGSILGPRGDGRPPRSSDYLDYDFYGNHEFQRRYEYFFQKMDETLQSHAAWRHASEMMLSKARDGIEKYVMDKLVDIAFNQLPQCQQWKKEDDKLFRRMKLLSVRANRLFLLPES